MPFSVDDFLSLADLGKTFEYFKKSELLQIATRFNLPTNSTMKKVEIKSIVAKKLIDVELMTLKGKTIIEIYI